MSKHPLYTVWQDMIRRCYNPSDQRYSWYGAIGITVCTEWKDDPVAFIEWCLLNGWVKGMEIDKDTRVPGNKIYSPQTYSIVTHRENMIAVVGRASGRKTSKLKLSVNDVKEIIQRKDAGEKTRILAEEYEVSIGTINRAYRLRG